ncbi:YkvA family protein [Aequorivita sediminis]|uniref:YkvA family protein n=1 Tax=Aequorivita sediminis TaxID=3073653 RepID=UPI0028AC92E2|nr:YkvA family protein [Aequorivita sp. F6058]
MSFKGIFSKKNFNPGNRDSGVTEDYLEEEVAKINDDDVEIVLQNEDEINKKFSGANSLSKYAELGKIMIGMIKDIKNRVYPEIPWFTFATIVLALLYVLNPFDIIPDFIPGIGYIDDVSVLAIGTGWIESDLHKYLDWKIKEGKGL